MNSSFPSPKLGSFATLFALLLVVVSTGCGSLMQRTASLEDDELYLDRGEEFITDAEYLAYAYEQAGYDAAAGEYDRMDSRSGDAFQSSFGYVPQSLRGRSMLRGYMTPYGAAGFGPNPYDPWGSSFYGGYSPYNPGFYDPYNPYGSPMGSCGFGYNSWGVNPYMGNSFGYNTYAYNPYGYGYTGYNPYGYGVGGFGGYGGYGGVYGGYGNGWGSDVFTVSNVVVAPRTPIWSSTSINSNAGGGRLLTNKDEEIQATGEPAAPMTIWRGVDAVGTGSSRPAATSTRPASTQSSNTKPEYISPARSKTTRSSRSNSSWGSSSGSNSGSSTRGSSTRSSSSRSTTTRSSSSSRNSSWSGSSSGSSRSSGSSTRSSSGSGSSRGSSGSSTGRSGGSSRNSGRGGGQPLR